MSQIRLQNSRKDEEWIWKTNQSHMAGTGPMDGCAAEKKIGHMATAMKMAMEI
jgi:hypothetical protein